MDPAHHALRVVIADRHPTVRRALARVLAAEPGVAVIAEVADLASAGMAVRRARADVLLVDVELFEQDGHLIGARSASTAIIVAGMDSEPALAGYFLARGATAYVLKDEAHMRLPALLRQMRPGY